MVYNASNMNILMFSRLYYPHIGGVEKHLKKISEVLIRKGHRVSILTEQFNKSLKTEEQVNGVPIRRIPTYHISESRKKWVVWKWMRENRQWWRKFDLIHVHDVFYWIFPFKFFGGTPPNYVTFHGYEGVNPPGYASVVQRKLAESLSSGSICVGDFMRKWYRANPDIVIYGGVSGKMSKKSASKNVIYLGRLSEDAGILIYLEALKILGKMGIELGLDVYGDGPQLNKAKEFSEKNNLRVKFYGFVSEEKVRFTSARFMFVSRYLGILEAMRAKQKVFAVYNNEIKKDYLKCHPMAKNMIISGDPNTLATHLLKYIKKPKIHDVKVEKAYKWAKKQTWGNVTEEYLKLWQKGR